MGDEVPEQGRKQYSKSNGEEYAKKLRDARWQQMRLQVFDRDKWQCRACFVGKDKGVTFNAHHTYYRKDADPWDYPADSIVTLCETCHERETHQRGQVERDLLKVLRQRGVLLDDLKWFASSLESGELIDNASNLMFVFGRILGDQHLQKLSMDLAYEKL